MVTHPDPGALDDIAVARARLAGADQDMVRLEFRECCHDFRVLGLDLVPQPPAIHSEGSGAVGLHGEWISKRGSTTDVHGAKRELLALEPVAVGDRWNWTLYLIVSGGHTS